MYVHTYVHMCMYIHAYVCICVCMYLSLLGLYMYMQCCMCNPDRHSVYSRYIWRAEETNKHCNGDDSVAGCVVP